MSEGKNTEKKEEFIPPPPLPSDEGEAPAKDKESGKSTRKHHHHRDSSTKKSSGKNRANSSSSSSLSSLAQVQSADSDEETTEPVVSDPKDVLKKSMMAASPNSALLLSAATAATDGGIAHDMNKETAHPNAPASHQRDSFSSSLSPESAASARGLLSFAGRTSCFVAQRPAPTQKRLIYGKYVKEREFEKFCKRRGGKSGNDLEDYISSMRSGSDKAIASGNLSDAAEMRKITEELERQTLSFSIRSQTNHRNASFVFALDNKRGEVIMKREKENHYYFWSKEMEEALSTPYSIFSPQQFCSSSARFAKGMEYVTSAWQFKAFQLNPPAIEGANIRVNGDGLREAVVGFINDTSKKTMLDQETHSLLALYPKPDFAFNPFNTIEYMDDLAIPELSKDCERRRNLQFQNGELPDPFRLCRTLSFTVKVHDLKFDKVNDFFEPLFCTMFIYDCEKHVKISEDFNFSANNPARFNTMLAPFRHRGQGVGGMSSYEPCMNKAVFHVNVPYGLENVLLLKNYMLVLCISKVLSACPMDDATDPYCKGIPEKGFDGMVNKTKDNIGKLGAYRQVLAWSMQPLFSIREDVSSPKEVCDDIDGESCLLEDYNIDENVSLLSGGRNFSPLFRHDYGYDTQPETITRVDGSKETVNAPVPFLKHFFQSNATVGTAGGTARRGLKTIPGRCSFSITNVSECLKNPLPAPADPNDPSPEELAAEALYDNVKYRVSPSYIPMTPFPPDTFDKQNVVFDLQQFQSDPRICEPLLEPKLNLLFIHLNFMTGLPSKLPSGVGKGKVNSICVKVQLMDKELGEDLDGVFFNNYNGEPLSKYAVSTVSYKNTHPSWNDTFKLQLPRFITKRMHLLFTIFTVNAKDAMKKRGLTDFGDFQVATRVGFAFVPLIDFVNKTYALHKGDLTLDVASEIIPDYLQPEVRSKIKFYPQCYLNITMEPATTMYATDPYLGRLFACSLGDELVNEKEGEVIENPGLMSYEQMVRYMTEFASQCSMSSLIEHIVIVLRKLFTMLMEGFVNGVDYAILGSVRAIMDVVCRFIKEKQTRQLHCILNDFLRYTDFVSLLCIYKADEDNYPGSEKKSEGKREKLTPAEAAEKILEAMKTFMTSDDSSAAAPPESYGVFENYSWIFLEIVHRLVMEHLIANKFVRVNETGTIVIDNFADRKTWYKSCPGLHEKLLDVMHLLVHGAVYSRNGKLLHNILMFMNRFQYVYDRNMLVNEILKNILLKEIVKNANEDTYITRIVYSALTDCELFNVYNVIITAATKRTNILEIMNKKIICRMLVGPSLVPRRVMINTLVDSLIKLDVDVRFIDSVNGRNLRDKIFSYYRVPLDVILKSIIPIDSDLWTFDPDESAAGTHSADLVYRRLLSIFALTILKHNFSYYSSIHGLSQHKLPMASILKLFKLAIAMFTMEFVPIVNQYQKYVPLEALTSTVAGRNSRFGNSKGKKVNPGASLRVPLGSGRRSSGAGTISELGQVLSDEQDNNFDEDGLDDQNSAAISASMTSSKRRQSTSVSLNMTAFKLSESEAVNRVRVAARGGFPFEESATAQRQLKSEAILLALKFMRSYMEQMTTLGCEAAQCFITVFIEMLKHHGIECDNVVYVDIYQTMIAFMRKFYTEILGYVKTNELSSAVQNLFFEVIQDCIVQRDSKKHFNSVRLLASVQFVYFCLKVNFLYTERKNVNIIKLCFTMALALILSDSNILNGFDQRLYVVFRNAVVLFYQEDQDVFGNNDDALLVLLTDFFCRLGIIIGDHMLLLSNAFHDPEYRADLYLRIANTYTETPKLRFHWLKKLFKLQTDNGNAAEAAACMCHMAAFVAEFLNEIERPVQCSVEKTHTTELSFKDFLAFTPNAEDEVKNAHLVIEAFSQLADLHEAEQKNAVVGVGVMNRDRLLKLLMSAAKSLEAAQLYEVLNECLRLALPLMEAKNNYAGICDAHLMLAKAYAMIIATEEATQTGNVAAAKAKKEEEAANTANVSHSTRRRASSPSPARVEKPVVIDRQALTPSDVQPRLLGTYYRVGVYGKPLGDDLNGCEWIYKMPKLTLLAQIKNMLIDQFNKVYNGDPTKNPVKITILQNSGEVAKDLYEKEDEIHIQLTKVEPYFSPDDLAGEERKTNAQKAFAIDEFIYETPFTTASTKQRHSNSVSDQWKLQTILTTEHKFPYLATRLRVKSRREIRQTPVQVAIEAVEIRTDRIRSAVTMNDPKLIQIILQGSCLPTVNGGPMELCRAFLPMLPVVFEDDAGTSTGDIDDVEDEDDEFLEEDDDDDADVSESKKAKTILIGSASQTPAISDVGSQADEKSSGTPDSDGDDGLTEEEKKKAAALAEEMRPTPEQLNKLRENVREFLKACGMALKVNKFMSAENDLFHREVSNGFEKLCDELYPYVGAIPGCAGVMGSQRALQTGRSRGVSIPATPSRGEVPVVNGNLIPSLRRENRRSRRYKGGSNGGTSALGGNSGASSTGSANRKIPKSETYSTISLSLARKRADESADGDPNSGTLSGIGASTPMPSRGHKKTTNTRLNVLSPINNSAASTPANSPAPSAGTPMASSASAEGSLNGSVTPLKVRVPLSQREDNSSSEDSGSDDDVDVVDVSEGDAEGGKKSKKGHRHGSRSRHRHDKE